MTIDLPRDIENQLEATAEAQGISVAQYVEKLVAETNLRNARMAEFKAAIAERVASLDAGESLDGEAVMDRLIADLSPR